MPSEIKITLAARELEGLKKEKSLSGKIATAAISFLEKYFGGTITLEMPEVLQEFDPELFPAIQIAEKLQELGIIKKIDKSEKHPDEPFAHRFHITTQKTTNTGTGADFFSEKDALWKAIGEAVERDIWATENNLVKNVLRLPYEKIAGEALNIFKLAGFSEEQKANNPDFHFDKKTIFGWVPAKPLTGYTKDDNVFCPAQLINSFYFRKNVTASEKEPLLRRCITTGLATGNFLEEAIVKGILEIIERDAYIISYLNRLSPPVIDFENLSYQDEELEKVYKSFKRYNLEVHLVKLPTDFKVHVISAIIIDKTGKGPAFVIGNSAKFDLKTAILGALSEALLIRFSLKNNWEEKKEKDLGVSENFGQFDRMIYWARPENFERLTFMTAGENIQLDLVAEGNFFQNGIEKEKEGYYKERLTELTKELQEKALEACYVEMTEQGTKKLGIRSVQVVIPELQPIHLEEKYPCLGGKRLQEVPKKLGYTPAENLNKDPHPFG